MIDVSLSSLSTQYIQVGVTVVSPSGYNPTNDVVQFSFTTATYPMTSPTVWHSGSWVTFPGPAYWAQCLVGTANSGVVLSQGQYQVWMKIMDNPEVPVLQPVILTITP